MNKNILFRKFTPYSFMLFMFSLLFKIWPFSILDKMNMSGVWPLCGFPEQK